LRVHSNQAHPDIAHTYGMLALSYYWQDELTQAREAITQARQMESELSDSDHSMIAWLVRLDTLLALENGDPIEPGQLGVTPEDCQDFDARTALGKRLCLGFWLVTGESANG